MKRININKYCVYFHVNKLTREIFYIGMGNKKRPNSKNGRNKWWHNIVNKYGYEITIPFKNISWEEAIKLEIDYIYLLGRKDLKLGPLVNLTDGGDGVPPGTPSWNKGISWSNETKKKISESLKGDKNFNYGKHFSIEHRKKISESNKFAQVKPVCQYTKSGEFIKSYISILEASKIIRCNPTTIGKCCREVPGVKTAGGFIWKFKNNI